MISFDRIMRKIFPSLSKLSYNWLFKSIVNLVDYPFRLLSHEFRNLPPNHLRIRVGVGNNLFGNQVGYVAGASKFWLATALDGLWTMDSTILDIGCGCGRYAHLLRDFKYQGQKFRGRYIGIDIDEEALGWCRRHFDSDRFTFIDSTHSSVSYNVNHDKNIYYRVDIPNESVDFVYSTSLFTHLLEKELINYLKESFRLLKPGKTMNMSVFCLDYPPPTYGSRHTFSHMLGNAFVESLRQPEAAVAYHEDFLIGASKDVGFSDAHILNAPGDWQPVLRCRK